MPYSIRREGDGYYVVSPHGHYLSHKPMTLEQATRQSSAVRLTELRKDHTIAERQPSYHADQSHTSTHSPANPDPTHMGREYLAGSTWVPVGREAVHVHGIIPTRDVFAPLPLPAHHLRKSIH